MSTDPTEGLLSQARGIPRKPVRSQMDESLKKRQDAVAERDLISYHNDKLFTSSSSLEGSDKSPPERQDTTTSLTSEQLMNYSNAPSPFATNTFSRYVHFLGLIVTTALSTVILLGTIKKYTVPVKTQKWIDGNDANVRMIVQVLATILGYLMGTPLSALINQGTRLVFAKKGATLNKIWFWYNVCGGTFTWHLPLKLWIYLCLFIFIFVGPSALWAPAISPSPVIVDHIGNVTIPSYGDTSFIHEYPSEFAASITPQDVRVAKGIFSYRVGIIQQGSLLKSASDATTVDGSDLKHDKLDNTGFIYTGRSYGVGASVGLTDDIILNNNYAQNYSYLETGYNTRVTCMYNESTAFSLKPLGSSGNIFQAIGELPDSNGKIENSTYFGNGSASIVALGVTSNKPPGTSTLVGIAAGSNYAALNRTQCTIEFLPTVFYVQVNITARNITVSPVVFMQATDLDATGNLQFTATRQLALISNDQTNFFQSLVGNSFISSIGNYNISNSNISSTLTESTSTLEGLQNSLTAMMDDILVAYASAQLMVADQTAITPVAISIQGTGFGTASQALGVVLWNLILIILFVEEAIRTRGWRGMHGWDYGDLRSVVVSASRGGRSIADHMAEQELPPEKRWRSWGITRAFTGQKTRFNSIHGTTLIGLNKETGAMILQKESEVQARRRKFSWHFGKKG